MEFDPSRLRSGEIIVGVAGVVLLVSMFAFDWYGLNGTIGKAAAVYGLPRAVNGWDGLTTLRWLMFLCAVGGIALFVLQGVRRTPAIPVSLSVVLTVVSLVTALALAYRVLINPPGPNSLIDGKAGAYVGLLSTVVLLFGAYRSLRREGVAERDAPREIETIRLGNAAGP